MKQILLILTMAFAMNAQARTFKPTSGMEFSCYDNVSGLTYQLTIEDIGDQTGTAKVFNHGRLLETYKNGEFREFSEGSYFVIWPNEGGAAVTENSGMTFDFPKNNLQESSYEDGGDSRPVKCKITQD